MEARSPALAAFAENRAGDPRRRCEGDPHGHFRWLHCHLPANLFVCCPCLVWSMFVCHALEVICLTVHESKATKGKNKEHARNDHIGLRVARPSTNASDAATSRTHTHQRTSHPQEQWSRRGCLDRVTSHVERAAAPLRAVLHSQRQRLASNSRRTHSYWNHTNASTTQPHTTHHTTVTANQPAALRSCTRRAASDPLTSNQRQCRAKTLILLPLPPSLPKRPHFRVQRRQDQWHAKERAIGARSHAALHPTMHQGGDDQWRRVARCAAGATLLRLFACQPGGTASARDM